jgi:hypothetical protein
MGDRLRFVMVRAGEQRNRNDVVLGWTAELRRLAAGGAR